jgi:hypothetical protein
VKFVIPAVFLLTLVLPAAAQSDCTMATADLPKTHGLRLGQSRQEVARLFGHASDRVVSSLGSRNTRSLEGIWFDFYQDALYVVEFDYTADAEWKDVGGFAETVSVELGLPAGAWVFVDRTEAMMNCTGFTAAVSTVRNTMTLTDSFAKSAAQRGYAPPTRNRTYQQPLASPRPLSGHQNK